MSLPVNFAKGLGVGRGTVVKEFYPGGVIVAKESVMFDVSQTGELRVLTVVQAAAAAGLGKFAGIALEAASGASTTTPIKVAVRGFVESAVATGGTAASATLACNTTAGTLTVATAADFSPVGVTLAAESGGFAPVYLFGHGEAGGL